MFLIFIAYTALASTFVLGAEAVKAAQPLFLTAIRMMLAGVVFMGVQWWRGERLRSRRDVLPFIVLAVTHIGLPFALEFWALQYISAAKTALIFNLSPFITAIVAYFLGTERISFTKGIGLLIGVFGVLPILMSQADAGETGLASLFRISGGELAIIIAMISCSYAWVEFKRLLNRGYSAPYINGIAMLGGGLGALVVSLYAESWNPWPVSDWFTVIWTVAALILVGNVIFYNLYGELLKKYSATFLSFAGSFTPLITAAMQYVAFGEGVNWAFWVSLVLVTVGLYVFYGQEQREQVA